MVAIPLEKAFRKYLSVLEIWAACIDDHACDFNQGAVNDEAQARWLEAMGLIARAEQRLDDLAPAE